MTCLLKLLCLIFPKSKRFVKKQQNLLSKSESKYRISLLMNPVPTISKKLFDPNTPILRKKRHGILTASLPDSLLPKCRADESLLAEIITKKFADHLPLYRIAEIFKREGIGISRKLLSQWVIRSAMALKPLYNEMLKRVLASKNIYIDETL